MSNLLLRLDDACERRHIINWDKIEKLLDKYNIKPLVGIIPHCEDPLMLYYKVDDDYWTRVQSWLDKGWAIAMHGYNHVYISQHGGMNPVHKRSEFAGLDLKLQCQKIRNGIQIFREHNIFPKIFFAPSHTFDRNTLNALKEESTIRIISDTIAWDCYQKYGFTFIPQQSSKVRSLPFATTTFCYHPNTMNFNDFEILEQFFKKNHFQNFEEVICKRNYTVFDGILQNMYFIKHRNK